MERPSRIARIGFPRTRPPNSSSRPWTIPTVGTGTPRNDSCSKSLLSSIECPRRLGDRGHPPGGSSCVPLYVGSPGGKDPGILERLSTTPTIRVRAAALHWIGIELSRGNTSSEVTRRRCTELLISVARGSSGTNPASWIAARDLNSCSRSDLSGIPKRGTRCFPHPVVDHQPLDPACERIGESGCPSHGAGHFPISHSRPPPAPVNPDADRAAVVQRLSPALQIQGNPTRGAATVSRLCLSCHYLKGRGQRIGPDLSGATSRTPESLLVDILDPGRQIAPDYAEYAVERTTGEITTGLIASETPTRITIRHPGSPDESIPQSEIRQIRATGHSLMPVGLEEGFKFRMSPTCFHSFVHRIQPHFPDVSSSPSVFLGVPSVPSLRKRWPDKFKDGPDRRHRWRFSSERDFLEWPNLSAWIGNPTIPSCSDFRRGSPDTKAGFY